MTGHPTAAPTPASRRSLLRRALRWLTEIRDGLHLRLRLLQLFARLLPTHLFGGSRAALLRLAGARVGAKALLFGAVDLHGAKLSCARLTIGNGVQIGPHCSIDLSGTVRIEDGVEIGHDVTIITAEHLLGAPHHRCGPLTPKPVVIGRGAWVGARVTLLPGVTVGAGSVVCAGSTVFHDVPPDTMVAGAPARAIRSLAPATARATETRNSGGRGMLVREHA